MSEPMCIGKPLKHFIRYEVGFRYADEEYNFSYHNSYKTMEQAVEKCVELLKNPRYKNNQSRQLKIRKVVIDEWNVFDETDDIRKLEEDKWRL